MDERFTWLLTLPAAALKPLLIGIRAGGVSAGLREDEASLGDLVARCFFVTRPFEAPPMPRLADKAQAVAVWPAQHSDGDGDGLRKKTRGRVRGVGKESN